MESLARRIGRLRRDGIRDQVDGHLSFVDLVYFVVVSLTTVGYGDIVPVTERARLIDAIIIPPARLLVWLVFVGTAFELFFSQGTGADPHGANAATA
jgi:voltage-gated potassium channel